MLLLDDLLPELPSPEATAAAAVVAAVALGLFLHFVLARAARAVARRTAGHLDDSLVAHGSRPIQVLLPLLAAWVALDPLLPDLPPLAGRLAGSFFRTAVPLAVGWFFAGLVFVVEDALLARFDIGARDNLLARKVYTQVKVLTRIALVGITLVTLAAILMSFDRLRQLGTGLLASAGIAGIILGFAAQKTLANLLAGFQIALTQPIRLDDVVIIEGEWGRIEEITLTYVVVRIWDLRRLVVPISYFLEKPFENWTRTEADLLGCVFLHVDYTVPVAAVRGKLEEILRASPRWDGRVWNLQVTETSERTLTLRALMSAPDSSTAWDLRCEVREALVGWLQESFPRALPRLRAETSQAAGPLEPASS